MGDTRERIYRFCFPVNKVCAECDTVLVLDALRLVQTCGPNSSQTKYTYVWTGLQACAALSANGSHTIRCELKYASFLHEHQGNWVRHVSSHIRLRFAKN